MALTILLSSRQSASDAERATPLRALGGRRVRLVWGFKGAVNAREGVLTVGESTWSISLRTADGYAWLIPLSEVRLVADPDTGDVLAGPWNVGRFSLVDAPRYVTWPFRPPTAAQDPLACPVCGQELPVRPPRALVGAGRLYPPPTRTELMAMCPFDGHAPFNDVATRMLADGRLQRTRREASG